MKTKLVQILSLVLAALLQVAPLLRSFLPNAQGLAPNAWGFILKIGVGSAALIGFDSVSKASSMALLAPNATAGTFYSSSISYAGHSSTVSSESVWGLCLYGGVTTNVDNLTFSYDGAYHILISGTPTNTTTMTISIPAEAWDSPINSISACNPYSNHQYTQTLKLIVAPAGGLPTAPTMTAAPQNQIAQMGTSVDLSGGASGNPAPKYQWWVGLTPLAGQTNPVLHFDNVDLTNAGLYTLTASNSVNGGGGTPLTLPAANCYLSVCITGGTNFSAYNYTNFAPAGIALTMFSWLTNTASGSNSYSWLYNNVTTVSTSNTVPLSASTLTPSKSGTYTVYLTSTNNGGVVVPTQPYDSYWQFGYLPFFTNSLPAATNVNAGSAVGFSVGISGSLNVQNVGGGAGGYSTNSGNPNVFWYQNGTTLVASQTNILNPTSLNTYTNAYSTNMASIATLTLNNVQPANAGNYTVVVTNFWGSITSTPVALTVASASSPPGFATQPPANISLLAGQSTSISCTVTGTPPITYQWQLAGGPLSDGGVYGGTGTNTLTLTGVTTLNGGNYTLAVTNISGGLTSSVAAVNIALPPSVSAGTVSPGIIQFNGNTVTGLNYVVQSATNLSSPLWTPIQTNNTGVSGAINFQTNTTSAPTTFYRLWFP